MPRGLGVRPWAPLCREVDEFERLGDGTAAHADAGGNAFGGADVRSMILSRLGGISGVDRTEWTGRCPPGRRWRWWLRVCECEPEAMHDSTPATQGRLRSGRGRRGGRGEILRNDVL